ncbi:MAG TPA: acyltransferase [Stellaceae bacterium]|nr:acyltransferase [Stellaceae bacterium]
MRLKFLDGARGIASLIVLIDHVIFSFPAYHHSVASLTDLANPVVWFRVTPLRLFVAGRPAVAIFFVLSGFVLALPFLAQRQGSYPDFLIKRVCRIWLPFAAAILVSAILCFYFYTDPRPPLWKFDAWTAPVTYGSIASHLFLVNGPDNISLDFVMWSLVHEMRISIIFPLIVFLVIYSPRRTIFAAFVLNVVCGYFLHRGHEFLTVGLAGTGFYLLFFVVGATLAAHAETVKATLKQIPRYRQAGLIGLSLLLLMIPAVTIIIDDMYLVGAALVISILLANPNAAAALETSIPTWLGRVSYSLYLIHVPILTAAVFALDPVLPLWTIMAIAVPMTLIVAELFHRAVEAPSMKLGRWLTQRRTAAAATGV